MSAGAEGTGGARYSRGTMEFQRIAAGLALVVLVLVYLEKDSSVAAIAVALFATYCGIAGVIYGGMAWVNRSERDPGFQAALAQREAAQTSGPRMPVPAHTGPPPTAPRSNAHGAAIEPPAARGRP